MARKTKITLQEAYELRTFMKRLESRRITTPEFKSMLILLRQHCERGGPLIEWTNSVAHKTRDRGLTRDSGVALWIERFEIDTFFDNKIPQLRKIPIPVF